MFKQLKSKTIKSKKPGLVLKPNHYDCFSSAPLRRWDSKSKGIAISDGQGWYITESEAARQKAVQNV